MATSKLIVAITGATGAVLGIRALEALRQAGVESHVIVSKWAQQTVAHETGMTLEDVRALSDVWYPPGDMAASISSGSCRTDGMLVIPCSAASLAAIATGAGTHLVHRAADVTLKERRRLVLVVRETPLSAVHLKNMLELARLGVTILPPLPAFYNQPASIDDLVNHIVARALDQFGIDTAFARRWNGEMNAPNQSDRQPTSEATRPRIRAK